MDAVDEVVLTQAAELAPEARRVLTIDDATGELTRWAAARAEVVTHADSLLVERGLAGAGFDAADDLATACEGVDLVLMRLPKSLPALDEYAELVARGAGAGVTLVAGGRVKHMGRGMNDVLARHFGEVRASLGVRKARALVAAAPRARPAAWPARQRHDDVGLTLCAHGACFGGTKVDRGTRLLLGALAEHHAISSATGDDLPGDTPRPPRNGHDGAGWPTRAVDLGCGNGTIAAWLALRDVRVTAIDESRAACASTQATARTNGVGALVDVHRADGLEDLPTASQPMIICNPPFHVGTAKDSSAALTMIKDAGRVLAPGGELWLVWNAHLPYLPALRRAVGPTAIVARDPRFIVTRSVRRTTRPPAP